MLRIRTRQTGMPSTPSSDCPATDPGPTGPHRACQAYHRSRLPLPSPSQLLLFRLRQPANSTRRTRRPRRVSANCVKPYTWRRRRRLVTRASARCERAASPVREAKRPVQSRHTVLYRNVLCRT
jgi:hypothetical protein